MPASRTERAQNDDDDDDDEQPYMYVCPIQLVVRSSIQSETRQASNRQTDRQDAEESSPSQSVDPIQCKEYMYNSGC